MTDTDQALAEIKRRASNVDVLIGSGGGVHITIREDALREALAEVFVALRQTACIAAAGHEPDRTPAWGTEAYLQGRRDARADVKDALSATPSQEPTE
jgi:hypothetical protein